MRIQRTLILLSLLLTAALEQAAAQREVLFSQYLINPLTINPAFTGARQSLNMTAVFRRKWFGVPGFPVTQSLGIDGAVAGKKVGLGLQALNDRMGFFSNTGVYGSVAYHFTLSPTATLSVGASGGINVLPVYDAASIAGYNRALPSAGVGVYYQSDRFWAGISKPELVARPLTLAGNRNSAIRYNRPLFVNLGGRLDAGEDIAVLPSILLSQQSGYPLGIDLNTKVWLLEKVGVGLSYRMNNSSLLTTLNYVVGMLEYQLSPAIRVAYSYSSQTIENTNFVQKSGHEIVFRYTPSPGGFLYQ